MSNLAASAVAAMCCISARFGVRASASGVAPAADVMAGRLHEDAEAHPAHRRLHYDALRVAAPTGPGASTAKSTVTLPAVSKTSVIGSMLPAVSGEASPLISR
jgi:hypothetical protein